MATIFSEMLKKLRREAGFPTAYRFYHDNGGKDVFRLSYRAYLMIEQGRILPPHRVVPVFLHSLRLIPGTHPEVALVRAWIREKLGKDTFELLVEPQLKEMPKPSITSPLHKVMGKFLETKEHISPAQQETIARDKPTYLCWLALSNDKGAWTPAELGKKLDLGEKPVRAALKALAKVKLVKAMRNGAYTCPFAGAILELPRVNTSKTAEKLRGLKAELISEGEEIFFRNGVLRAEEADFTNYLPLMSLNISAAAAYAVNRKTVKTAIYAVECRAVKLRDF